VTPLQLVKYRGSPGKKPLKAGKKAPFRPRDSAPLLIPSARGRKRSLPDVPLLNIDTSLAAFTKPVSARFAIGSSAHVMRANEVMVQIRENAHQQRFNVAVGVRVATLDGPIVTRADTGTSVQVKFHFGEAVIDGRLAAQAMSIMLNMMVLSTTVSLYKYDDVDLDSTPCSKLSRRDSDYSGSTDLSDEGSNGVCCCSLWNTDPSSSHSSSRTMSGSDFSSDGSAASNLNVVFDTLAIGTPRTDPVRTAKEFGYSRVLEFDSECSETSIGSSSSSSASLSSGHGLPGPSVYNSLNRSKQVTVGRVGFFHPLCRSDFQPTELPTVTQIIQETSISLLHEFETGSEDSLFVASIKELMFSLQGRGSPPWAVLQKVSISSRTSKDSPFTTERSSSGDENVSVLLEDVDDFDLWCECLMPSELDLDFEI
jgi:hypothetical protein